MSDSNEAMPKEEESPRKPRKRLKRVLLVVLIVILAGLAAAAYGPIRTMASLEKVDDYPLFVMHYRGPYFTDQVAEVGMDWEPLRKVYTRVNPDACTSFAALSPEGDSFFGRNFDWRHRSSLLLFTEPAGGYASVSMVDLYYLQLEGMQHIPWSKRFTLLAAPHAIVEGMNACGVAIAVNAVPERKVPRDPNRPTLIQSQVMRLVLDHAADVNEALQIIGEYNIDFLLPGHFHIADAYGGSAIVEFTGGKMQVVRNDVPWQVSTNYLLSEPIQPDCWRYNAANESLVAAGGHMSAKGAMNILEATKQNHTVWSVVYNLHTGEIHIAMGKNYDKVHTFKLKMRLRPVRVGRVTQTAGVTLMRRAS